MAQILIIEPDKTLAKIYTEACLSVGHNVNLAWGAQEAIDVIDRQKPDLVIMELQLVSHNGLEFLYEFRSYPEWQTVPVIINSLVPSDEFSEHLNLRTQLGVSQYLYKPETSLWQLLHAISTNLQPANQAVS